MKIHVIVPEVRDSLENAVCLDLMISCLTQQMIQDTYPADLAQLQYSVNSGITREMGKEGRHCITCYLSKLLPYCFDARNFYRGTKKMPTYKFNFFFTLL